MQSQVIMYIPSCRASWPGLLGGCDYLAVFCKVHGVLYYTSYPQRLSRNQRVRSHSPELSQLPPYLSNKFLISTCCFRFLSETEFSPSWWLAKTVSLYYTTGFPGGTSGKEPACHCRSLKIHWFDPWVRKLPCRRAQQPKGARRAKVHRVTNVRNDWETQHACMHILHYRYILFYRYVYYSTGF